MLPDVIKPVPVPILTYQQRGPVTFTWGQYHIDGLAQERHKSIANALELRLSCTSPSIWNVQHIETRLEIINSKSQPHLPLANEFYGTPNRTLMLIFWYQKMIFWYQKFLISENHFLMSENQFLIPENVWIFYIRKSFSDIRKSISDIRISFSDIRNYFLISENVTIFWYQKFWFSDIREN